MVFTKEMNNYLQVFTSNTVELISKHLEKGRENER